MTQEEAAARVGKSRSAVTNALRLLNLAPSAAELVESGRLSAGHARALLPLSPALQVKAAEAVVSGGALRPPDRGPGQAPHGGEAGEKGPSAGVDYVAEAQRDLSARLGRGVKIVNGRKKGRIELEYYGLDDLNDLLEALALLRSRGR